MAAKPAKFKNDNENLPSKKIFTKKQCQFTINFHSTDVIVAAGSGEVVSDVPVRCVTGHINAIFSQMWTGSLSWILCTGVVEFVLETHRQNIDQLRMRTKKNWAA